MKPIAVVTDSNSGITQQEAEKLGIFVLPMPFYINDELFLEGITLSQEEFYEKLKGDASINTSQPSPASVTELWDKVLAGYETIVHIPMSSGLSTSCESGSADPATRRRRSRRIMRERFMWWTTREFPSRSASRCWMP